MLRIQNAYRPHISHNKVEVGISNQTDFGTILGVYTRFDKIYAFFVTGA